MRIRIVQCLCGPPRHAILAMAVNDASMTNVEALGALRAAVSLMLDGRGTELAMPPALNPWCGLCGAASRHWTYEIGWSRDFPDWEAAQQELRQSEADQRGSTALLELLDATFDGRMRREVERQVDDAHRQS